MKVSTYELGGYTRAVIIVGSFCLDWYAMGKNGPYSRCGA